VASVALLSTWKIGPSPLGNHSQSVHQMTFVRYHPFIDGMQMVVMCGHVRAIIAVASAPVFVGDIQDQ